MILRWKAQAVIASLLILVGVFLTLPIDPGDQGDATPAPASFLPAAPRLSMTLGRDQLVIRGTTGSQGHETAIAAAIADRFPDLQVRSEYMAGVLLPENWEPVSMRLLYVMAAMESATAEMSTDRVELRGVTAQADLFQQRLAFLREALAANATMVEDVIVVDSEMALDDLCRRAFAELGELPVAFMESSAELRESSYPSLDKLVDFAWHCSDAVIVIVGHTDSTGDEGWNRQLSRARAQAVADYLAGNGIRPERLVVEGRGSADPVADNSTRYGRRLNRRIEFELR